MPMKSCFLLFLEFVGVRYLLISTAGYSCIFDTLFMTAEIHVSPLSFRWHITPRAKKTDGMCSEPLSGKERPLASDDALDRTRTCTVLPRDQKEHAHTYSATSVCCFLRTDSSACLLLSFVTPL